MSGTYYAFKKSLIAPVQVFWNTLSGILNFQVRIYLENTRKAICEICSWLSQLNPTFNLFLPLHHKFKTDILDPPNQSTHQMSSIKLPWLVPCRLKNSASWLLTEFLNHKIWSYNKMVDVLRLQVFGRLVMQQ